MKNFRKAPLMAFVLGLGLIVGMSSFKMISNNQKTVDDPYVFVNVNYDLRPDSTDPSDYEYRPLINCDFSSSTITCKASWLEATAPTTTGQHPTGTYSAKVENGEPIL